MIVITTPTGTIGHQVLENVLGSGEPIRLPGLHPAGLRRHPEPGGAGLLGSAMEAPAY